MSTMLRRRLTALLALSLVTFGLGVTTGAGTAAAYSSTAQTDQYPYPHNGCSSPFGDSPSGVSFTDACNRHDGCYGGHWADKWTCDQWFLRDMLIACASNERCQPWAYSYWHAVTVFGWPYYACSCDPDIPYVPEATDRAGNAAATITNAQAQAPAASAA